MNTRKQIIVTDSLAKRFWSKVVRRDPDWCWEWIGCRDKQGYGYIWSGVTRRSTYRAHRVAYTMLKGPIVPELVLDHLCLNPSCVNPQHLQAVPQRTNVLRQPTIMKRRTATQCGQGHPYDRQNSYVTRSGGRRCRECRTEYRRAYWKRVGR